MKESHRLTTILFADIAGYTSLMEESENRALKLLNHFKSILTHGVEQFEGEIIQYYGDGCLMAFQSSTKGVSCGIELQKQFIAEEIPVRIGIHIGEVLFKENNVYGDAISGWNQWPGIDMAYLSNTHHQLGNTEGSERYRRELISRMESGENNIHQALAMIYTAREEYDIALDHHEQALEAREFTLVPMSTLDPVFRPLHKMPRFIDIRNQLQFYGKEAAM